MAAGGVCAPVVIPLREFTPGSRATKNVVDEKTPIELFSVFITQTPRTLLSITPSMVKNQSHFKSLERNRLSST
jgi:hypothetical protein